MLWITITTDNEAEYLDAASFLIKDGIYHILLLDGTKHEGKVSDITFLHTEAVEKETR